MKSPHLYLSQGFVIQGTPVTKEEFERETGNKTAFGKDAVFLEDVTLFNTSGGVASVQYFVLDGTAVAGAGKNNIRVSNLMNASNVLNNLPSH
jgi:hypothetical protein